MAQRVGVDAREAGARRSRRHQVVHPLAGQRLITFGNEQPRQRVGGSEYVLVQNPRGSEKC
jgi:hypothetical protein